MSTKLVSADFALMDGRHDGVFGTKEIKLAGGKIGQDSGARRLIDAFAMGCTSQHTDPLSLRWNEDMTGNARPSGEAQNIHSYFANKKSISEYDVDAVAFVGLKTELAHGNVKPKRNSILDFFKLHTFVAPPFPPTLNPYQQTYITNWQTTTVDAYKNHWSSWAGTTIRGIASGGGAFNYSNKFCRFRYFSHGIMASEKTAAGEKLIKDIDYNDIFSNVVPDVNGVKHVFLVSDCGAPFIGDACRYRNYTTPIHIHCMFSNATFSDAKSSESPKTRHYGSDVEGHCAQLNMTGEPFVKKWAHVYLGDDDWERCDKFGLLNFEVHREAYHREPSYPYNLMEYVQMNTHGWAALTKHPHANQLDTSTHPPGGAKMHDFESRSYIRWTKNRDGTAAETVARFNPWYVASDPNHSTKIRSGVDQTKERMGFVEVHIPATATKSAKLVWQPSAVLAANGAAGMRDAIRIAQQKRLGDHGAIRFCKWLQLTGNYNVPNSFHITLPDYRAGVAARTAPWMWWNADENAATNYNGKAYEGLRDAVAAGTPGHVTPADAVTKAQADHTAANVTLINANAAVANAAGTAAHAAANAAADRADLAARAKDNQLTVAQARGTMTYPQEPDNADYLQDVRALVDGAALAAAPVAATDEEKAAIPNKNNTFFVTGDYPAFHFAIFNRINSIMCVRQQRDKGYFVAVYDQ